MNLADMISMLKYIGANVLPKANNEQHSLKASISLNLWLLAILVEGGILGGGDLEPSMIKAASYLLDMGELKFKTVLCFQIATWNILRGHPYNLAAASHPYSISGEVSRFHGRRTILISLYFVGGEPLREILHGTHGKSEFTFGPILHYNLFKYTRVRGTGSG